VQSLNGCEHGETGSLLAFKSVQSWTVVSGSEQGAIYFSREPPAAWSPDGKQLAFGRRGLTTGGIYIVDLSTRQMSLLPGSENIYSPRWSPDGNDLAALNTDSTRLMLFNFKTQKWSEWIKESCLGFPNWSSDGKYVYYDTAFSEKSSYRRVKVGEGSSELLIDLRGLRRYAAPPAYGWSTVAPDGSWLFTRDLTTDEIYALDVELP
jgi:Tol biopolymer transport system component